MKFQAETHELVSQMVLKIDENTQRQLQGHQAHFVAHDNRLQTAEAAIQELKATQASLLTSVAQCSRAVESASSVAATFELEKKQTWDGEPNPTILRGHTQERVTLAAFKVCVA